MLVANSSSRLEFYFSSWSPSLFQITEFTRKLWLSKSLIHFIMLLAHPDAEVLFVTHVNLPFTIFDELLSPVLIFNAIFHEIANELVCCLFLLFIWLIWVVCSCGMEQVPETSTIDLLLGHSTTSCTISRHFSN